MVSGSSTPPTDFVGGVIFSTSTRSMSGRSNRRVAIVVVVVVVVVVAHSDARVCRADPRGWKFRLSRGRDDES